MGFRFLSCGRPLSYLGRALALSLMLGASPGLTQELQSEFVMEVVIEAGDPQTIGDVPLGARAIYPVTGGSFEGPEIKGKIIDGADWLIVRRDGVYELDVRVTLETVGGELIYMNYVGFISAAPDIMAGLLAGGDVSPDQYYMRTTPRFETSAQTYAWMNSAVFVGVGQMSDGAVSYRIYAIE